MEEAFEQKLHEMRQRFADILHILCITKQTRYGSFKGIKNVATETSTIEGMGSNGAACVVMNLREDGASEVDANANVDADSASGEAARIDKKARKKARKEARNALARTANEGEAPGKYLSLLSPTLSPIDVFP